MRFEFPIRLSIRRWAPALTIGAAFLLVGCYTILKHPITAEEGPQTEPIDHPQAYYRQNCIDCHEDYAEYPYGYFYGAYPDYYFEYPRWGYYYAYPWWWDRYWYDDAGGGYAPSGQDGSTEGDADTKVARRGGLVPPYVDRVPALPTQGGGYQTPDRPTTGSTGEGTGRTTTVTQPAGSGTKGRVVVEETKTKNKNSGNDTTGAQTTKGRKTERRGGVTPP